MSDCKVCTGEVDPWCVSITGNLVSVEHFVYAGVRYWNHGAEYRDGATTIWLAPVEACGEGVPA